MSSPRRASLRYSANAVVRKEAELRNLSPEFSVAFFNEMMDRVLSSAMDNGQCWLPGIGTFKRTDFKARKRRNPRTGEVVEVPAGEKLVFVPAKPRKLKTAPATPATLPGQSLSSQRGTAKDATTTREKAAGTRTSGVVFSSTT